jgi:hypothetical protein
MTWFITGVNKTKMGVKLLENFKAARSSFQKQEYKNKNFRIVTKSYLS